MTLSIDLRTLSTPAGTLLRDLRIEVRPGVVHTVMGVSGSGKSSLLSALCGTLPSGLAFEGEIVLNGRRIDALPTSARRVGILFQDDLLFAHMTVRENLLFAVAAGAQAQRDAAVQQALRQIEMGDHADADPATLSGGQRTRVALARALLAQPLALMLDEPFARLDAALRSRMRELVFRLVGERGIPALLVTHDGADIADAGHLTELPATGSINHA
jgi:putative thiamine transport system ATP-binding protein